MQTRIVCTRCTWVRIITPSHPADLATDLRNAHRIIAEIGACPVCRDVNIRAEQFDLFGQPVG